jgi:tRNA(Arg) A34 adenosine deaminase TadA
MDKFVEMALNQALHSDSHHKHGSVLILCKNMIFTGYNHTTNASGSLTVHSEEHAINNFIEWCRLRRRTDCFIRRKLHNSIVVTVRVKNNLLKTSSPCKMCLNLIQKYGIKKVLYSDQNQVVTKKTRDIHDPYISSGYRNV